jgi:hypothetical protein
MDYGYLNAIRVLRNFGDDGTTWCRGWELSNIGSQRAFSYSYTRFA